MKIILLRHGESDENGLNEIGKEQAAKRAEFLKSNGIDINKSIIK